MAATAPGVEALFAGKDRAVRDLYARVPAVIGELGPFREEPKKTSIRLARGVGFALILNMQTERPIESDRVVKWEQVSKNRWHDEVWLSAPGEVDDELAGRLRDAYALR